MAQDKPTSLLVRFNNAVAAALRAATQSVLIFVGVVLAIAGVLAFVLQIHAYLRWGE